MRRVEDVEPPFPLKTLLKRATSLFNSLSKINYFILFKDQNKINYFISYRQVVKKFVKNPRIKKITLLTFQLITFLTH
jgi:hypothetical protein